MDMVYKNIYLGSYMMVHIGTTNTIKIRCVPEIALKASNNSTGHSFMNIFSGGK